MYNRYRRRREEQNGNAPWLTTYGDMVTLLLTFFVLLYSFSTVDAQKFQSLMIALQGALGVLPGGQTVSVVPTPISSEIPSIPREELDQIRAIYEQMQSFVAMGELSGTVDLVLEERGLVVRFAERAFFDLGKADLRPDTLPVLEKVAEVLRPLPNHVRVEGHTDNLPINTPRFPSNWELSTARATSVIRYLIEEQGLDPERLSAAGYGEYRPVDTNDTPEGRARNRRVDLVILRLGLSSAEPPGVEE
ncbi:MAG: OmpA family protein [Firmicutes bacterium]|nr:OmpA family protein [Bacillota bacterium]